MIKDRLSNIDPSLFCWRKEWIKPCESVWSLLHKFAFLNAIDFTVIRKIIYPENITYGKLKYERRTDLRFASGLNIERLAAIFQISQYSVSKGTVGFYISYDEIEILSASSLRFCLECLSQGFHTPIHQLLFFEKCPIHNEVLLNKCLVCKSEIPYHLSKKALKNPYSCPTCGISLSSFFKDRNTKEIKPKLNYKILGEIIRWLKKRREITLDNLQRIENKRKHNFIKDTKFLFHINGLANYWSDVLNVSQDLEAVINNEIKPKNSHYKITYPSEKCALKIEPLHYQEQFNAQWNKQLFQTYKSVEQQLTNNLIKKHLKCVDRIFTQTRIHPEAIENLCCIAGAYLIWKMHFENKTNLERLFRRYYSKRDFLPSIQWDPPNYKLPLQIIKQIFALECYWTFYECKLLAAMIKNHKIKSLENIRVTNYFQPYWMVVQHNKIDNGSIDFHWWIDQPTLTTMVDKINH